MTALHSGSSTSQLLNAVRTALQMERVSHLRGSATVQRGTFLWARSRRRVGLGSHLPSPL
jgi:hypothetical protein